MGAHKQNTDENSKNPLGAYYYSLTKDEKLVFRSRALDALGVDKCTLYRWLDASTRPRKSEGEILASLCGVPAEKLYPYHYPLLTR
ncbi:MAG: hypothetical protein RR551_08230 [Mucinivorans sp.]